MPKKQVNNRNPDGTFPEGVSGNPKGRPPKGYSITEMMKEMLSSKPEVKEAIGKSILKKALEGDVTAMRMLWQYMDGMPLNKTELTGKDGESLSINLVDSGYLSRYNKTDGSSDRSSE